MDYKGQELSENIYQIIILAFGVVGWIYGYVLNDLTHRTSLVLATGGGAVTQLANREFLKQRGIVVYLYTPVELQLQRTYRDKNRPLLQVENPEQKLRDLLATRDPLYREIAHHVIETNQGAARDLAQRILQLILSKQVK